MQQTKTVHFYTTGESFTNLCNNFFEEGNFKTLIAILEDGGMSKEHQKQYFLGNIKFVGDTRDDSLTFHFEASKEDTSYKLYWAVINALSGTGFEIYQIYDAANCENKNIDLLFELFDVSELVKLIWQNIIRGMGYEIKDAKNLYKATNGVILSSGEYITCDYEGHTYLYRILDSLKLVDNSSWLQEETAIHVSSGSISGPLGYAIGSNGNGRLVPTDSQLQALFDHKENIKGQYSGDKSTTELIRRQTVETINKGGKYGNLMFLNKYYPKIKTPVISLEPIPFTENYCIRTSPKESLPGLLTSKFNITDSSKAIEEIKADWELVKNVHNRNQLHIFYQENLSGVNGVCHYYHRDRTFTYAASERQGAIVGGGALTFTLTIEEQNEIRGIASMLSKDFERDLQLEFVITKNGIYIVQLRLLQNGPEKAAAHSIPEKCLCYGITFSRGKGIFKKENILIVNGDEESKSLLGYEALIVRDDLEFSHLLALSKSLRIPSLYGVGNFDFTQYKELEIVAINQEAYITEPK